MLKQTPELKLLTERNVVPTDYLLDETERSIAKIKPIFLAKAIGLASWMFLNDCNEKGEVLQDYHKYLKRACRMLGLNTIYSEVLVKISTELSPSTVMGLGERIQQYHGKTKPNKILIPKQKGNQQ